MGMDPLTAFSLACGVIQVVDFSTEVLKRCRRLYKDGNLSRNKDAEEMAQQLTQLRASLSLPDHPDQDILLKLGDKCSAIAKDLVAELEKLKVSGPHRKRQVIEKAIKTIWKKTAIDDIQKRLDDCHKILDHRVLIELRKRFDLLSFQQKEGFQSLDQRVQTIIISLAQGPKTFEQLKTLIQNETQSVKELVTNELQQHRTDLAQKDYRQRFLDSLWFPEIYRRQETIHEAHEKTFQWIYEPEQPDETVRRWDNFVHWLESDQCTYWINGKAGSGKSTLMNYIYQDQRTAASLKVWSGSKELFTLGFFFWNAGGILEKSSEGLLRSLIYQLLKRLPSLTPSSQIGSSSEWTHNDSWSYEPIAAWTERRLLATFRSVLRQAQEMCRICVFIDGLDEFSGDQDMLIELIESVQTADVKVCISSRPYRSYSEAFGSSAKLQLQDLTYSYIRRYVSDKLHPLVNTNSAEDIYPTFDTIVYKAKGVFLWVELVVKDLIKGLKNNDSLEQLQERLDLMPSDIEDLYSHMLSKIDKIYQTQAAKLFQMALSDQRCSLTLFTLALALFRRSTRITDVGLSDLISYCEEAKKKLPIICAGLLEVQVWCDDEVSAGTFFSLDPSLWLEIPFTKSSELAEVTRLARYGYIDFIHRTARDYLEQSKQGQQFLDTNSPSNYNPHISLAEMLLTEATVLGFGDMSLVSASTCYSSNLCQDREASLMVHDIMDHVCLAGRQGEFAQVALCDDIDSTLTAINDRHGLPSPKILHEIMENISKAERQKGTARVSLCAEYENILAGINQGSSSKAHWSVRWGIINRNSVAGDDQVASLSSSSGSSSIDSFHSIDGDPILRGNSRVLPTRPVDFVGVAALWGLSRYVEQKLGSNNKTIDQDIADYLLCCSMWGFHDIYRNPSPSFPSHQISGLCVLIVECLRLGADCNLYIEDFSNTLWGDFLTQVRKFISRRQSDIDRIFAMTGKAFLENGADVQVRVHREIAVRLSGLCSLEGQVVLESNRHQEFACIEEITALYALYAIQEVCGGMPEFEALEKRILNMGGSSSSKWTQIALEGFRPYKISEQQSCDLKAAFRGYGANDDENGSVQTRQKWALQIARLYKEIRGDTSDTDEPGSSNASFVWDYLWRGGSHVEAGLVLRLGGSSEVHSLQPYEI